MPTEAERQSKEAMRDISVRAKADACNNGYSGSLADGESE